MLRLGLTGGIGSGKSTVARVLEDLGAFLIDSDVIAREVVAPGSAGLDALVERFGEAILAEDGTLNRPALGAIAFADDDSRRALEAIVHPAIAARTAELYDAAPAGAVIVHDVPLLVEVGLAPTYHLVLMVHTEVETRVARLMEHRGFTEADARARIATQATDEQRRAVADVWLDNNGAPELLKSRVRELWEQRLAPYHQNLVAHTRARHPARLTLSEPDPEWSTIGRRFESRLRHLLGDRAVTIDHVGSTSIPDLIAKEVFDLQIGVRSLTDADDPEFIRLLTEGGFPPGSAGVTAHDNAKDGAVWSKRFFGSSDPGRFAHVHVREVGSPGWRWALGFREALRADSQLRAAYAAEKIRLSHTTDDADVYADAKEPWFDSVHDRIEPYAAAVPLP